METTATSNATPTTTPKKRKDPVRFTDETDAALLTEVLAHSPYGAERGSKTAAWGREAAAMVIDVDARRCRERCADILDELAARMRASERGSGLAESHTELDDLLANVAELCEEEEAHQEEKKQLRDKRNEDDERAETMRDEAMVGMKKRKVRHDVLPDLIAHVKARDEANRSLEERKVVNEEARLVIDRARLEQDREERKALIDLLHCITVKVLPQ
ncbi:hypothetical protein PF006_g22649 [Phytophthora fragariae]|uniref:Uncharacterized protein n=1 Tax=Phytophthora fragariae TaxID=53985 RepID=A0A6A3RPK1_9STRA|nr:hypothetical protein PF011_g21875 [Phytophthora fragariae]KAE9101518.1 hypothetical protein PF006_g22649 [Phytophthora fragariae]